MKHRSHLIQMDSYARAPTFGEVRAQLLQQALGSHPGQIRRDRLTRDPAERLAMLTAQSRSVTIGHHANRRKPRKFKPQDFRRPREGFLGTG